MHRSEPGPVASLLLVAVGTTFFLLDRARGRRALQRNENGECGRCGAVLLEPGARMQIAGGPYAVVRAHVCPHCAGVLRLQERIFWSFIAAALVGSVVLLWWNQSHH